MCFCQRQLVNEAITATLTALDQMYDNNKCTEVHDTKYNKQLTIITHKYISLYIFIFVLPM